MKIGTQLFYGCVMGISLQLAAMVPARSTAALEEAKQQWVAYANTAVLIKMAKFLKTFDISTSVLHNEELLTLAQYHLDEHVNEEIARHKATILTKDIAAQECAAIKNVAYGIADELHFKSKIKVIHDDTLDEFNIGIMSSKRPKTCLILVNALKYVHHPEELSDALRHEFCHVVCQDALYKDLLKSIALADDPTQRTKINSAFWPVARAQEVRADIYAAVHSPYYGKDSIAFLRKMKQMGGDDGWPAYPSAQDRITTLELVKDNLEAAAKKR